jgi:hypothetical protein
LLLPLFPEVELFGVKIKKEVEKLKTDVNENLNGLSLQLMDLKISNSNANTINIGNNFLPTEQRLKELADEFISKPEDSSDEQSKSKPSEEPSLTSKTDVESFDFDITDETLFLFKVRFYLEKMLTTICKKTNKDEPIPTSTLGKISYLGFLLGDKVDLYREVAKIVNRGVHGEIISNEYISFIKKVLPELQTQLNYYDSILPLCYRCGSTMINNVCPYCGLKRDARYIR